MRRRSLSALVVAGLVVSAFGQKSEVPKGLDKFNQKFTAAVLHMDNAEVMSLWAEDGVMLLPGMAPISGKANIAKWLDGVTSRMPGYRVIRQEDLFHAIAVSGDWASEWATTLQVTQPPGGKPAIESHGKMLLVLHREKDGTWRIRAEMWNGSPAS